MKTAKLRERISRNREKMNRKQASLPRITSLPKQDERWKYPNDMLDDWAALSRRGR